MFRRRGENRICPVEGCSEPSYRGNARCHQHHLEYVKSRRRAHQETRRTPPLCPLCCCTPDVANVRAHMGIFCTKCTPAPRPFRSPLPPRRKSVTVLRVNYQTNTLEKLTARVIEETPLPETERELKQMLKDLRRQGALVAEL